MTLCNVFIFTARRRDDKFTHCKLFILVDNIIIICHKPHLSKFNCIIKLDQQVKKSLQKLACTAKRRAEKIPI